MKIREANIDDYKAVQKLSIQLGYEYPVNEVKEKLSSILKDIDHRIILAINPITDEVIGYIHVQKYQTLYFDDLLNILGMVIDEAWRNKGVGSALIQKIEEIAGEFKCKGIRAASSVKRTDAHMFYQRRGFDIIKEQKRFIKRLDV